MTLQLEQTIRDWVSVCHGWMSPERAVEMAELVLVNKPKTILELGVFGGRSFISQALALKEIGEGVIYGVDAWNVDWTLEGENDQNKAWWKTINMHEIHRAAVEAIWKYGLEKQAILIRAPSQYCHDLFRKVNMVMLDGNHSEVASCRDVELYLPKLVKDGILVMDDTDWPTTAKAQEMIQAKCALLKDGKTYKIFRKL